jgi:hypothetical protein
MAQTVEIGGDFDWNLDALLHGNWKAGAVTFLTRVSRPMVRCDSLMRGRRVTEERAGCELEYSRPQGRPGHADAVGWTLLGKPLSLRGLRKWHGDGPADRPDLVEGLHLSCGDDVCGREQSRTESQRRGLWFERWVGASQWRLPTLTEWQATNSSRGRSCVSAGTDGQFGNDVLQRRFRRSHGVNERALFGVSIPSNYYFWSSTIYEVSGAAAWGAYLTSGGTAVGAWQIPTASFRPFGGGHVRPDER